MSDLHDWKIRYSRQIRFSSIGEAGQRRLGAGSVLIAGTGALGASLAQHMVRAGVGLVRLVDRDYVEASNLHRQSLFDEADALAAMPKAVAAANKLERMNSEIRIEARVMNLDAENVDALLEGIDLVLDGTDNAETRLVLSDACFARGIPFIYGGVAGSEGMTAALVPGETACLRCLIGGGGEADGAGRSCETIGVISPAVEAVAALQAAEAMKWLSGSEKRLRRSLISLDIWEFAVQEYRLPKPGRSCRFCGSAAERAGEVGRNGNIGVSADAAGPGGGSPEKAAVMLCGRDTVQVTLSNPISLPEAERQMAAAGCREIAANRYLLKWALPEGERIVLFEGGRVLVQGTQDEERAIRLCQKYLQHGRDSA